MSDRERDRKKREIEEGERKSKRKRKRDFVRINIMRTPKLNTSADSPNEWHIATRFWKKMSKNVSTEVFSLTHITFPFLIIFHFVFL